ncbi:MAG: hypothetical protein D6803_08240 [Anaerolineae bacterium]|nr:MAG: hypothetical protein D6803_08240 [Anaerolineae bacterium]
MARFSSAAQLHAYVQTAMPYWQPGILSEEEGWQVTAFLLRENDLWSGGGELGPENASDLDLSAARRRIRWPGVFALAVTALLLSSLVVFLWRRRFMDERE